MKKLYRFAPVFMIVTVILLQACSAKKNTAGSRFWQALNTRYNVYYHGKTNYDEQIKVLEDEYQDDYSQRLFVHPAEAKANPKAPQPGGSFDRTIEKMQKAIALHSIKKKPKKTGRSNDPKVKEWMSREEYNPFLHNAWYLLAKSEYMKGDFLNAAATFRYISRHFPWKEDLAVESQVWEALCYCALGWTNEADNVLAHVHIEKIENKRIRALANMAFADYYMKDNRNEQAIPYLAKAAMEAKGSQKVRLNFLLGQLYEEAGDNARAYQAYKKAGSSSSSTYRTKFNARIKQSAVFSGSNVSGEVKALRNMARYDRNKEYLDQIYYAIGNLYLSRQDTVHAIENYVKAAEKSTRNGVDKAISQLTLGGVYFAQHKYDKAQPCYAEAIPLINETYPNYKMLKHRSDVLDELAVYSQNVTLQDSLLKLSKLPLDEQKKVIKKIIDELKKKEKEEEEAAKREEYMAQQAANGNNLPQGNKNQPTTYQINNDNSWYFYNTATKNAGKTAFQQQWGNRKLEDNWRRRNKNTFSLGDDTDSDSNAPADSTAAAAADTTQVDKEALKRAEDPHYEEYYLKQIPSTEEQVQAAHDVIMEGLYNMGVILKDKLEDMDAAEYQFLELQRRYPENTYRLDSYYNMYLMYMRYGKTSKAEECRDIILAEFADSKYGQAMQDPNYLDNLKNMESDQEAMYAQAYSDYLNNNNEAVHDAYAAMMSKYPLSKIMPKFMFIDALSYVTQKDYDQFKATLKDMLQRYPETDITPVASGIMKNLNSGRKLNGGSSNTRGMIWSMRLGNDTTPADLERKFTPFKEDLDKPHVFILLYPTDSISSNMLLYEVARHNFNSFVVKDYDLEQMTFGRLGLLVVKGMANYDEAVHYRSVYEANKEKVIPDDLHKVLISENNFQLLLNEGRSFEDYFNYLESKNDSIVEGKVPGLDEVKKANAALEGDTVVESASGNMIKHVVKSGDKLSKLATTYGVTVADIQKANNMTDDKIKIGDTLLIPVKNEEAKDAETADKAAEQAKKEAEAKAKKEAEAKKKAEEQAKKEAEAAAKKEAEAKKKAEEQAKKEAEARAKKEAEAAKKAEAQPQQTATIEGDVIKHVVKSGDKLGKLATTYGVTVDDIKKANNLPDDRIRLGQTLLIPAKAAGNNQANTPSTSYVEHMVKPGESLGKIAMAYGVTVADIKKTNGLSSDKIRMGQTLRIPVKNEDVPAPGTGIVTPPGSNKQQPAAGSLGQADSDPAGEPRPMPGEEPNIAAGGNDGSQPAVTDGNKDENQDGEKKDIDEKKRTTKSREQLMREQREKREQALREREERQKAERENAEAKNEAQPAADGKTADGKKDDSKTVDDKKQQAAAKKAAEAKKKEEEKIRKEQAKKAQQEQKAKLKQEEEQRKQEEARLKNQLKQEQREAKAREKAEEARLKATENVDKKRMKELEKIEKHKQDSIKRAEKEADKLLAKQQKAIEDSIARMEKAREDSLDALDQARIDARKQMEKSRADIEREKAQAKIDARKQQEKERKERMKAKEEERKQKAKERKEREKEREKARKEREKQRKAEAKEKERLQKEKEREREQARKEREREREEARKQRERERKK